MVLNHKKINHTFEIVFHNYDLCFYSFRLAEMVENGRGSVLQISGQFMFLQTSKFDHSEANFICHFIPLCDDLVSFVKFILNLFSYLIWGTLFAWALILCNFRSLWLISLIILYKKRGKKIKTLSWDITVLLISLFLFSDVNWDYPAVMEINFPF